MHSTKYRLQDLLGPVDDANRALGLDVVLIEDFEDLQPSENAENAIVAATRWLCVQVRPHHDWRHVFLLAGSNGEKVAHLVEEGLAAQLFGRPHEPVSHFLVRVIETQPSHARLRRKPASM